MTPSRFRFFVRCAVLAAVSWLAGCHAYAHATLGELGGGDRVRALLTPPQAAELSGVLPLQDRVVEGEVVEAAPGELLLEVPVHTGVAGIRVESLHQRVRIPAAGLADLERRSLHRSRTYAVLGAVAGAVGFVIWNQLRSRGRDGGETPPDPPAESPRFRFAVPVGWP